MIIEKLIKNTDLGPLVEASGNSKEGLPTGYAPGSTIYFTDTRSYMKFDGTEWIDISEKGGSGSGAKMPKDCAFYITEYGDSSVIEEQNDNIYTTIYLENVAKKAKNIGEGLRLRAEKMMQLANEDSNLTEYGYMALTPMTIEEYDLNGLTTLPCWGLYNLHLKNIVGLDKITTYEPCAFAQVLLYTDKEVISFDNLENFEIPPKYEADFSNYGSQGIGVGDSCFNGFTTTAKVLKFPKLKKVGYHMFDYAKVETLDFDSLETVAYDGFYSLLVKNIIIRTDRKCNFEIDSEYNITFARATGGQTPINVKVPANLLSEYQNDPKWSRFVSNGTIMLSAIEE